VANSGGSSSSSAASSWLESIPDVSSGLEDFDEKGELANSRDNYFQILGLAGQGAFGKVWKVRGRPCNGAEGKICAMKQLNKAQIVQRELVKNTMAERDIMVAVRDCIARSVLRERRVRWLTEWCSRARATVDHRQLTGHPFIVDLYYAFQTDTELFLVMEYLPGTCLPSIHPSLTHSLTHSLAYSNQSSPWQ